jgi:hypothetical protein
MEKRIVALFDIHVPYNIPLDPVWEFIKDFKPHRVVVAGDAHDWTAVSSWLADQSRALEGGTIESNYEDLRSSVLTPLYRAIPRDCDVVLQKGNHEGRLERAIEIHPNGRGFWELEKNLRMYKRLTILPQNSVVPLGPDLVVVHGEYATGQHHAKKMVEAYHTSVLYGHRHTFQSHTLVSPVTSSNFYTGQAIGCLCTLNPEFLKGKPNAWVNGFAYVYLQLDGSFHHVPIVIVNNKFYANGHRYV